MLQKIYSIYSDDLSDAQLFIEAGKNHIACWCKKEGNNVLRAFEFFRCDDYDADTLEELFDNTRLHSRLLTMPVNSTNFLWNTDEVLCLPLEKNSMDFLNANFELMFGNSIETKIFSAPTEHCLVAWRIESRQQYIAQQCFRGALFTHPFVPLLNTFKSIKENAFWLFFYPHYFSLVLFKDEKLQFAQTRKYDAAEDVLYFILNVCRRYDMRKAVDVFCGGFIDERSKLYETLFQYLEGMQLMEAGESQFTTEEFKEYAPHYFIPYINYVV